jgi:hypothetical protein
MDSLIQKVSSFGKKYGFRIYGSVPTEIIKEPDFQGKLNRRYTIHYTEKDETRTLLQWLQGIPALPKTKRITFQDKTGKKQIDAISKLVYFTVFSDNAVDQIFPTKDSQQAAVDGAITYLATESLGDAVLEALSSPMGSLISHEGVVIRDKNISNVPFKITGSFITRGALESPFKK